MLVGVLFIICLLLLIVCFERWWRLQKQRRFVDVIVRSFQTFAQKGAGPQGRIADVRREQERLAATLINREMDVIARQMTRLSAERDVLRHILQTMTTGVIYIGANGRIEMMNQAAEKMFLQRFEQVEGNEHWTLIHNYELGAALDNALLFGRQWAGEMSLKPGMTVSVQVIPILQDQPVEVASRERYTALLLCTDVSQWRRLEQMRSDFVANVSHELKTPITAIQGFAETLLDGMHDPETATEFVKVIHEESVRMKNLVSDLLTLTRLETGDKQAESGEVDLLELVNATLRVVEPIAASAGVRLLNRISEETVVWGAAEQLKQVLLNLVVNAVHYTPNGGVVTVYAEPYVDRVKVHVSDTGIGIPKEHQERVFERFYRVDKDRSRATGGTGLGLAIAKHIVQSHGGAIGVDSQPGLGSDFWFTVPRLQGIDRDS